MIENCSSISCYGCWACIDICHWLSTCSDKFCSQQLTSAAKSMAGAAENKTMGAANKTSEAANSTMSNATQAGSSGNQSASNSTNPLAKVPIIRKLFGGK